MSIQEIYHPFTLIYFAILLLIIYKHLGYPFRLLRYRYPELKANNQGLSVIISAKNEAENLNNFLPYILEQDYPNFEVIVINDQSWDNTATVLEDLKINYPNLISINIDHSIAEFKGKKLALTLGIKEAKNDILVFTDADCKPHSTNWLRHISNAYNSPEIMIVLGYSPYENFSGLLNFIISYETLNTAINYFSAALNGYPYMGVGRNLSYRKSHFFAQNGFSPFLKVPYGDDDLFVNKSATKKNTNVCLHPDSFVESIPKSNWNDYFFQKQRHQAASPHYKSSSKISQMIGYLIPFVFYIFPLILIIDFKPWFYISIIFTLGSLIVSIPKMILSKKLNYGYLGLISIIFEPIYIYIYQPIIGVAGIIRNKNQVW